MATKKPQSARITAPACPSPTAARPSRSLRSQGPDDPCPPTPARGVEPQAAPRPRRAAWPRRAWCGVGQPPTGQQGGGVPRAPVPHRSCVQLNARDGRARIAGVRAVVSRVTRASVTVDGEVVGAIAEPGLLVLLGVTHDDTVERAATM